MGKRKSKKSKQENEKEKEVEKTQNLDSLLYKCNLNKKKTQLIYTEAENLYNKKAFKDAINFYETAQKNNQHLNLEQKIGITQKLAICYSHEKNYEYNVDPNLSSDKL